MFGTKSSITRKFWVTDIKSPGDGDILNFAEKYYTAKTVQITWQMA
jgi:hypothetical protein